MLVLVSSIIFEDKLVLVPIGIGSLHISDVLLIALLLKIYYRNMTDNHYFLAQSPLNLSLGLFYSYVVVTALVSVICYGMEFAIVFKALRVFSYYLVYFLVTNLIRERKQIELVVVGMYVIAVFVAVAMLAQVFVGDSVQIIPGRIEQAETIDQAYDALRLLPPGQTLLYVMLITTVCLITLEARNVTRLSYYLGLAGLLGAGVMLTYNRSYWVAIVLALIFLYLMISGRHRSRFLLVSLSAVTAMAVFITIGMNYPSSREYIVSMAERFSSLGAGDDLIQSGSIADRFNENEYAMKKIAENPLFGIGLYNDYRPQIYEPEDDLTHYVHNGYLWLLVDMGIVGFLLFAWFYVGFIVRCWRNWRYIKDSRSQALVVGFMLSAIGIIPMALLNPVYFQWFSIIVLGTIAGLCDSILNENGGVQIVG